MLSVQKPADMRWLVLIEGHSQREVARLTGSTRDSVAEPVASETLPKYSRAPESSNLHPVKAWIREVAGASDDPGAAAAGAGGRAGYGGKTIFDDYVGEVRPHYRVWRTFQRNDLSAG